MATSIRSASLCGLNSKNLVLMVAAVFLCGATVVSGLYDDLGFLGVKVRPQRSSIRGSMLRTLFSKGRREESNFLEPKCFVHKQSCDRWNNHCCAGLQCMTLDKGFCTTGDFDQCACFPIKDYMGERGGIWYKRSHP